MLYSIALGRLRAKLDDHGIILKVKARGASKAFWCSAGVSATFNKDKDDSATTVVEVTYVDDEAIMLAATSPKALNRAIATLLEVLVDVFRKFGFRINWKEGKTECFVTFRGRHAAEEKRKLIIDRASKIPLPPHADADSLRV
eukprot:5852134-Karenia_brevis.AAC.1